MSEPSGVGCERCQDADPHTRHAHYLFLASSQSLGAAKEHVMADLESRFDDKERVRHYAQDITDWLSGQIDNYSHWVNENTGEEMNLVDGRKAVIKAMRETYASIAARWTDKQGPPRYVEGFDSVDIGQKDFSKKSRP